VSSGCPSNQAQFPFVSGAGGGFAEDAANGSVACGGIVTSQGGHAYGSPTLIPLIGGSGGSGGSGDTNSRGGGGGGGGGAILLASSTSITFGGGNGQGTIKSRGGDGTTGSGGGGGGSGGAIRLIANTITGAASFDVTGGAAAGSFSSSAGAPGRVRIETSSSTGFNPTIAPINKPGIISFALPSSVNPGNPPQLIITSVAGQNAPATPTNSIHGSPDLVVPNAQPNPVTVGLAATNIPVGTAVEVRVTPQVGSPTSVQSTALTGSIASSTATASINLPVGMNVITATVTVTLSASVRPLFIDGQQIGRIEVAAVYGRSGSEVTYISTSGRRITNK
jgi:hypothetical protein